MKISKLHLSVGVLILLFVGVCLFYLVPKSGGPDSSAKSTTQESSTEYMASQYKKIESAAKKHNVVVVTYDTNASYSKTFINMVKATARNYPDIYVLFVKNDTGSFLKYLHENENTSVSQLGKLPNTNIFILRKGEKLGYLALQHYIGSDGKHGWDTYTKDAESGIQPITPGTSPITGDFDRDNVYLLERIDTDSEAKRLIQQAVIDFSFNQVNQHPEK